MGIAAIALIALFAGGTLTTLAFIWSGSVFLIIFTVIWLLVDINVAKASRGIVKIERAVNSMVGQQRLLSWEKRHRLIADRKTTKGPLSKNRVLGVTAQRG